MANYLFTDKDRLRNELSEIENLEVAYTKIASMHSQQNKQSAINAYRSWYNKVAVICNAVFGKDDDVANGKNNGWIISADGVEEVLHLFTPKQVSAFITHIQATICEGMDAEVYASFKHEMLKDD